MDKGKLGVLGGMGPQATAIFYQRIIDHTLAATDQEHLPMLLLSDTQVPDRTAALLAEDTAEVEARLLADAKVLENWGATAIAIPCNTSHAFLPRLQSKVAVPIVNMIQETAAALKESGAERVGILATDGTLRMGLYHAALKKAGMEPVSPPPDTQKLVMDVIYDQIKKGERGRGTDLAAIGAALREEGCDRAVLACTELSVCKEWHHLPDFYLDAMDVLADTCITLCGYPLRDR